MSSDLLVSPGHVAWLPSDEANDLRVHHFHGIPLIGTFTSRGGESFLFACVVGPSDALSLWSYVWITATERDFLDDTAFESLEQLQMYAYALYTNRNALFAMARADRILLWNRHDVEDNLAATARKATVEINDARMINESADFRGTVLDESSEMLHELASW